MKYKQPIITILLSVVITLAIVFTAIWGINYLKSHSASVSTWDVSIIQLIANPEQYDGKTVRVIGVGNLEFEENCLSLSKEDLACSVGNTVWLELGNIGISYEEARQYNGEYVIVEGVFDKDDQGHMNMFHGAIKNITRYELWRVHTYYDPSTFFTVTRNDDFTYSYQVTDQNGATLFAKENATREPVVSQVSNHVLGLTTQMGTGLSTNWAVFCDVENSKVSEIFQYVLLAQGDYVIYVPYKEDGHAIVVQNIFAPAQYQKEYILSDSAPIPGEVITDATLNGEGVAVITYLTGENKTETQMTIHFP